MPEPQLTELISSLPADAVSADTEQVQLYSTDLGPVVDLQMPAAVVWPRTIE